MDFSENSSENHTVSWHPGPTTRGSFTILSSCVITLTLCVWKVVHLNLPEHEGCLPKRKKTNLKYWMTRWISLQQWRKVGWLILGIFAPEMVSTSGIIVDILILIWLRIGVPGILCFCFYFLLRLSFSPIHDTMLPSSWQYKRFQTSLYC